MERDEDRHKDLVLLNDRLALVSVLHELTVAAVDLFDPQAPIDRFLHILAARLGARLALCLEQPDEADAPLRLSGAAGLSRRSRELALPAVDRPIDWSRVSLPYPELRAAPQSWVIRIDQGPQDAEAVWWLLLRFDAEPRPQRAYRMAERVALTLGFALRHRRLYAQLLSRERDLSSANLQMALQHKSLIELYTKEQRSRGLAERLQASAQAVNQSLDLDVVLPAILDQLHAVIEYDSGTIQLLERDSMRVIAARGFPASEVGRVHRLEQRPYSRRLASDPAPIIIQDTAATALWPPRHPHPEIRSNIGVPLVVRDRIIGALTIDRHRPNRYTAEDAEAAMAFARQAAIAIENARLYGAEHAAREQGERLRAATHALGTTMDVQEVFALILRELRGVVPYDSASIQELQGRQFVVVGGHGFPDLREAIGVSFDVGSSDSPNGEVARRREPMILEDAPLLYASFLSGPSAAAGVRSWMGVPLLFGDRLIGMLTLDKRDPGFYRPEHGRVALAFAAQAAIAMENARLYTSAQRELAERGRAEERLATQYAVARHLAASTTLTGAVRPLLRALCEELGWDVGELWLVDEHVSLVRRSEGWRAADLGADPGLEAFRRSSFAPGVGLPGRVWRSGQAAWVPDVLAEPQPLRPELCADEGLRSALGVPILLGAQVLGVIAFFSREVRAPDEDLLQMMTAIGSQLGQFIEHRRSEEAEAGLRTAIEKAAMEWESTFDSMEMPILILDARGRLVRLNHAARDLAGSSEALGRTVTDLGRGQPWHEASELAGQVGQTRSATQRQVRDEATGKTWDITASPSPGFTADETRVIVVARDVTQMVELQESLRRSEKMSAMGMLVAGVAHEVRNPLFSISANLDAFELKAGAREELKPFVSLMRGEVTRLATLMQGLLDYGKPVPSARCPGSIGEVVARAVQRSAPVAAQKQVQLVSRVVPGLPPVLMDLKRLVKVFQKLLQNAIQHTPKSDVVTVEASTEDSGPGAWIVVTVEDSGPGFAPEELPLAFEPFYTRRRGGTGLGLAIAQRIVEEHGGTVSAANRKEGGARVVVRLPPVESSRTTRSPSEHGIL